ncbi:MAG: aminotransferase class V-fold PLP-dependent enzyme [Ruminococcaceae bacterium]|nr:aminotransferase class V-fold PLP-dependent enzyme [Oscillospiraceae bacterium]
MIYLDNAATSFPKPAAVTEAVLHCLRREGGNPGRGGHRLSMLAAERLYECREEIAALFGSRHPENVIFTPNATAAINLALKGLLRQGDHVLISDLEHNAVWRPICRLAREGRITYDLFPSLALRPDRTAEAICQGIEAMLRPNTRMVVCTHASNICSALMPIREIGALCRRRGLLFVVDAAQSAGREVIRLEDMGIHALCAPGHKGLFGLQGSGFLLLGDGIRADTLMEGGSGVHSLDEAMPEDPPERYEAGTPATPAIAGLCAGIRTVRSIGQDNIAKTEAHFNRLLEERLADLRNIRVICPHLKGSILLLHAPRIPSEILGQELDRRGICVRAGFHCAALAHRTLGTVADGAVRISPGYRSERSDADAVWKALKEITMK